MSALQLCLYRRWTQAIKDWTNYQQLNTSLQFPGNWGKENTIWHIYCNPHTVVLNVLHILDECQSYSCSQVLLPSCGCLILQWKQENSLLTHNISQSLIYIACKCNFSWHMDSCVVLHWEKNSFWMLVSKKGGELWKGQYLSAQGSDPPPHSIATSQHIPWPPQLRRLHCCLSNSPVFPLPHCKAFSCCLYLHPSEKAGAESLMRQPRSSLSVSSPAQDQSCLTCLCQQKAGALGISCGTWTSLHME